MVAKIPDRYGLAALAPQIFKPLRKMRNVSPLEMATRMGISERTYRDFENGSTNLQVERILEFAEILRLDRSAIMAAFFQRKPQIAHDFALNKFMLVQASAVDELDAESRIAVAAVDALTVLDGHLQLFRQLAEYGRLQLQAGDGKPRNDES